MPWQGDWYQDAETGRWVQAQWIGSGKGSKGRSLSNTTFKNSTTAARTRGLKNERKRIRNSRKNGF